ncbi:MAG: aminoacyl-tRNA hydrolase [Chloroflexota bacterium]
MTESIYLIAGLGNPGKEYKNTRHNIGFMLADRLAERLGLKFSRLESKALVTRGEYQAHKVILAKPQTFMNLSGTAVGALLRYYKAPLSNLLVAYDDVDLPPGTVRIRPGGSSGGQKGMASIIERVGTADFPRLRLGIGRPPGRMEAADYVLQSFSTGDLAVIQPAIERGVDAALLFIAQGLEAAMNQYNGAAQLE